MTGIGTARARKGNLTLSVEIRSVNHRFLDIVFRLPPALGAFEIPLRKRLSDEIDRGRVSLSIELETVNPEPQIEVNDSFVEAYVAQARRLAKRHGLRDDLGVSQVLSLEDAFSVREQKLDPDLLGETVDKALTLALKRFHRMRATEGRALRRELTQRTKLVDAQLSIVSRHGSEIGKEMERRLRERLARAGASDLVDPQRLAAEVTLLADRATISEEIERLRSHIAQFLEALRSREPVAKRLGFLLQEMHREVNTIGSKSSHLQITDAVLRMKQELESVREQIQNLE